MNKLLIALLFLLASLQAFAQDKKVTEKPKMQFMGAYDAGQAGANIYKMFDPAEDVVCYILMPETAGRKAVEGGKWIYDGNNIGSISCLKVKLPVVPLVPSAPQR
ncbi:hypothetical protein ICN42_08945 [Polynucleobacter sp. 71A-WALBACH]|uniref:hypothetical protein n=1 Tax=Polynucleobacter sp. 71A-WALBACH TaxID=2689097 RepID=UPI001C0DEC6E|nr:hypothetical protein [Polynucleobacter sp. 71A-WALBACH]MBU3594219.1 hypothetical protein [Polynucleobacter sp. 71A-WALBACH]